MSFVVFAYADKSMKKAEMERLGRITVGNHSDCKFVFPFLSEKFYTDIDGVVADERRVLSKAPPVSIAVMEKQLHFGNTIILQAREAYSLGRGQDNAFILPTRLTSSKHAMLSVVNNNWVIRDLRSTNGTYVNGQKIEHQVLVDGDNIHLSGWELVYNNGMLTFLSTPVEPILNFEPVLAPNKKATISYPLFSRSPRIKVQPLQEDIDFESPQHKQELAQSSMLDSVLPGALMGVFNPLSLAYAVPNILISGKSRVKQKKTFEKKEKNRVEQYNNYLTELDVYLNEKYEEQEQLLHSLNPAPQDCLSIAADRQLRLWERLPFDSDYLTVRLGLGEVESGLNIRVPRVNINAAADELFERPREFKEKYTWIHNAPNALDLKEAITIGLTGDHDSVTNSVFDIVMNVATHHPYDEVKLICLYDEKETSKWNWIDWLPHAWSDDKSIRFTASNKQAAKELLRELSETLKFRQKEIDEEDKYNTGVRLPYYIFIIADRKLAENHIIMRQLLQNNPYLGAVSIFAYDDISYLPHQCRSIVECSKQSTVFYYREDFSTKKECTPDSLDSAMLETFARSLAPIRLRKLATGSSIPGCVTFLQGMNAKKCEELNVLDRWSKSEPFRELAVPIGVKHGGETFIFDLHEKEFGPHGLVAGTTGYGKSELLQTWLLSLALHYRPDEVSFVLIDFKGEGLAGSLDRLPHVAGKISNIDISGIKRNLVALEAELNRRQVVFSETKIKDIYKYQQAYRDGKVTVNAGDKMQERGG